MAFAMGSIMAVVAVLLNHMDKKEDVSIIPKINLEKNTSTYITVISPICAGVALPGEQDYCNLKHFNESY